MKMSLLAIALVCFASASFAASEPPKEAPPPPPGPPAFVPIDQELFTAWVERIKKAPWDQANPVLVVLDAMEREAVANAAKKEAAKPAANPHAKPKEGDAK